MRRSEKKRNQRIGHESNNCDDPSKKHHLVKIGDQYYRCAPSGTFPPHIASDFCIRCGQIWRSGDQTFFVTADNAPIGALVCKKCVLPDDAYVAQTIYHQYSESTIEPRSWVYSALFGNPEIGQRSADDLWIKLSMLSNDWCVVSMVGGFPEAYTRQEVEQATKQPLFDMVYWGSSYKSRHYGPREAFTGPIHEIGRIKFVGMRDGEEVHLVSPHLRKDKPAARNWREIRDQWKSEQKKGISMGVRLYRDQDVMAVETDLQDENAFLDAAASALQKAVMESEDEAEQAYVIRRYSAQMFEILCKLRGYKADVSIRQVVWSGTIPASALPISVELNDRKQIRTHEDIMKEA